MINDLLLIIFFACFSAAFSYMLDYGLGKPGSTDPEDISVTEFLSWWTLALARRRLIENGMFEEIESAFIMPKNPYSKIMVEKEFKKTVIEKGREFFTWEKAVGGCIICSGFWVAVIISVIFVFVFPVTFSFLPKYLLLLTTPVFSHFILRKI